MRGLALILGLGAMLAPSLAGADAPVTSPLPPQRPAVAVAPVATPSGSALAPAQSQWPLARTARMAPQPPAPVSTLRAPLSSPLPPARPTGDLVYVSAPVPDASRKPGKGASVCGVPAIKGKDIAPIAASAKGCGLTDGVRVTSISGVALSTPADIDCATAKALNRWVDQTLLPAVGNAGGGVAQLEVAASYVCRPRNNQRGNRISEHGKGHAIDISAIVLESGKAISVQRDWGKGQGGRILKKIRVAACGTFNTVLGPGSDRFHRDHLHFDTARGRGPYCR